MFSGCVCSHHPKICSCRALGAMLLFCCHARVWPPDGDLHPQCSSPSLGWPLQKCILLSTPCSSSACRALVSASRGWPRVGTRGRMLNPSHTGWAAQEGPTCPGGLQQVPLLPGDGACSSASHTKPAGLPITYCRDPRITGTVSHASWGLGDAQLLSSGKLNLGLFLDKIINTVVRRADLHLGLCLQTCPVPMGPAVAPATAGRCFWLRQGVLSATLSPTAGFIGKDPPMDMPMTLGDNQ